MTNREILYALIDYYCEGGKRSQVEFAKKLGIMKQRLAGWLDRDMFDPFLIYEKCPEISADWLLSGGKGSMLRPAPIKAEERGMIDIIYVQSRTIDRLVSMLQGAGKGAEKCVPQGPGRCLRGDENLVQNVQNDGLKTPEGSEPKMQNPPKRPLR